MKRCAMWLLEEVSPLVRHWVNLRGKCLSKIHLGDVAQSKWTMYTYDEHVSSMPARVSYCSRVTKSQRDNATSWSKVHGRQTARTFRNGHHLSCFYYPIITKHATANCCNRLHLLRFYYAFMAHDPLICKGYTLYIATLWPKIGTTLVLAHKTFILCILSTLFS